LEAYKFSLEKVLEWRTDKEKDKARELAIIQRRLHEEEEKLEGLLNRLSQAKREIQSYKNIQKLQQQRLYIDQIEEEIERKKIEIEEITKRFDKSREELLAAQKDRKVMEKLKEKDFQSYKTQIQKKEQKQLDEAAILRYRQA